ncbi:hypothetical protein BV898_14781 [Hypsibius exemplaris]|uniref:Sema domain-containing protein n=1 Tax=Hypsibius exemplaris TaxID=2072580 RepID=A0A9X6NCT0_HYPEX|nr:hypothetical protein BV898_14781 [Hypsibius exemplaris]
MLQQKDSFLFWIFQFVILVNVDVAIGIVYRHLDENVTFQHVLQDSSSGDLFVLNQWNEIFGFTAELQLKKLRRSSGSPVIRNVETPAEQQVFLAMTPAERRLLACSLESCGIAKQGSENDSDFWTWTRLNRTNAANVFTHKNLSVLAASHTTERSTLVYTSFQTSETSTAVLSARELQPELGTFRFTKHRGSESILTVHPSMLETHPVKPIFLQVLTKKNPESRHSYGYLITLQRDPHSEDPQKFVTRIGRFCAGDSSLKSYNEVTIKCQGRSYRSRMHTIAMSAAMEEGPDGKQYLAVVFGRGQKTDWDVMGPDSRENHTYLCVFPLKTVDAHFDNEVKRCFEKGDGNLLKWALGEKKECRPNKTLTALFVTGDLLLMKDQLEETSTAARELARLPIKSFFPKAQSATPIHSARNENGTRYTILARSERLLDRRFPYGRVPTHDHHNHALFDHYNIDHAHFVHNLFDHARLEHASIFSHTHFGHARFYSHTHFGLARFYSHTHFGHARFYSHAHFIDYARLGHAFFSQSTLATPASTATPISATPTSLTTPAWDTPSSVTPS